jgi:hypothetical protein
MFKKKIVAALALSSMVGSTFAAGANSDAYFDGFYGQVEVGLGSQTNTNTFGYGGSFGGGNSYNESYQVQYGKVNPQYAFTLGYSKKVLDLPGDNDINLAVNFTYNATSGDSGKNTSAYNDTYNNQSYATTSTYSTQTKNIYAISVEPGYYLSKHGLGYLKVGWAQGSTSMNQSYSWSSVSSQSYNFGNQQGLLFGFGFKHGLNAAHPNIFWGLEAYQINMNAKTITADPSCAQYGYSCTVTSKPSLLFGKIHLGYMFD